MTKKKERRKHKRYPTKKGSYATISPNSHVLGQIVDISMGGLAFKYIDTKPDKKNRSSNKETLFLSSMDNYVGDINFETIDDYEAPDFETPDVSFDTMTIRIRHIKFLDLKLKQLFDLDYYIENNASKSSNGL